jgi:hypothetical protein
MSESWPAIRRPLNGTLNEDAGTTMGNTVTMTDEHIFVAKGIDGTMACGLKLLLVTLEEERPPTL